MPKIEKVLPLKKGNDFYVKQNVESRLEMYVLEQGKLNLYRTPVLDGSWNDLAWELADFNLLDKDIVGIEGDSLEELDLLVLKKIDEMRAVKIPDEGPIYANTTPYRLYWATDTQKMYINISDTWVFCGTLNHDLMNGAGKFTHAEIDAFLETAVKPFTLNSLSGDVNLIAGSGIQVNNDPTTGTIEIVNTGGGSSTRELRVMESKRYFVQEENVAGQVVEYVDIPSEILPMDEVINVPIVEGELENRLYTNDMQEYVIEGWYDNNQIVNDSDPANHMYIIPLPLAGNYTMTFPSAPARFRVGLWPAGRRPQKGDQNKQNLISESDGNRTVFSFTTTEADLWLGYYGARLGQPLLPLTLTCPTRKAKMPNWVPEVARLEDLIGSVPVVSGLPARTSMKDGSMILFNESPNNKKLAVACEGKWWLTQNLSPYTPVASNYYRYVRVGHRGSLGFPNNSYYAEVEVYDKTGVNVALGKPAYVDGYPDKLCPGLTDGITVQGDYTKPNMTDPIAGLGPFNKRVIDLGQAVEIDSITVFNYYGRIDAHYRSKDYTIEVSVDGVAWTTITEEAEHEESSMGSTYLVIPNDAVGQTCKYIIDSTLGTQIIGEGNTPGNANMYITKIKVFDMSGKDISTQLSIPRVGFANGTLSHKSGTIPSTARNCYNNTDLLADTYTEVTSVNETARTGIVMEWPNNEIKEISRIQIWHYRGDGTVSDQRRYRNEELYLSMDGVNMETVLKHSGVGPVETIKGQSVDLLS